MNVPTRSLRIPAASPQETAELLYREWLVTNGLGGYAAGTVCGVPTRRYHGLLIAALAAPMGRTMMLNDITEQVRTPDGKVYRLEAPEAYEATGEKKDESPAAKKPDADSTGRTAPGPEPPEGGASAGRSVLGWRPGGTKSNGIETGRLVEFRLVNGLPVWIFEVAGRRIEKRIIMPQRQNTVYLVYTMAPGGGPVRLELFPALHFRAADATVSTNISETYALTLEADRYEITAGSFPPLRLLLHGQSGAFTIDRRRTGELMYRMEASRGYASHEDLWSPGWFHLDLDSSRPATLIASTDRWERIHAMTPPEAVANETERRRLLLQSARMPGRTDEAAELVFAADQFLITPAGRIQDSARARAAGYEIKTVVAGYHWFTDWGRDTMISLEGLALATGRHIEAGSILRTFAYYIRDGLIPNLFPEGHTEGLYHTADATLWFFHAMQRYLDVTGDRGTLQLLLPKLIDCVDHHLHGTLFGIAVDPKDGLLRQGQEGYQLTWMDAKVEDWVVTPRRGKAVEINALWYNALRILEAWLREEGNDRAAEMGEHAQRALESFNRRFWYEEGRYLYDVVDGENGDDPALRPNQIFAISCDHPVLERGRWEPVLSIVERKLLTPVGLRTLSPDHPDFKPRYDGDVRARDAAYHQGTVWPWLIGPWVDAWLRAHEGDRRGARRFLEPLLPRLNDDCIGTLCEIFDAEPPYAPRGCAAQAWSVAELLRAWLKTEDDHG